MHNSLLIVNNTDRRNGRKSLDIYVRCDRYYLVILRLKYFFLKAYVKYFKYIQILGPEF